jgi:uncharacterized Zn-finger protein
MQQHLRSCINTGLELKVQVQRLTDEQVLACQVPAPFDVTQLDALKGADECGKCFKSFSTLAKLITHKLSHSSKRPFKCDISGCLYMYKTPRGLQQHKAFMHKSVPCTCCYCGVSFNAEAVYLRHLEKHKTDTPDVFKCLHIGCLETFSVPLELTQHMKQHLVTTVCGVLDCLFTSKSKFGLKSHRKSVHSLWMHNCQLCGRGFDWYKKFRQHGKEHEIEEPVEFKCMKIGCPETFTSGTDLKEHVESHDKISTQVVDSTIYQLKTPAKDESQFCGKNFQKAGVLKVHVGKHKTETPGVLKCIYGGCKQTFTSATDLKQHAVVHWDFAKSETRPFVCDFPECNFAFKTNHDLLRHKRHVHSSDSWMCHICDKKFTHISYVTRHIQKQH